MKWTKPRFLKNKKAPPDHFAVKSPSLFRDSSLRSAVSLVCSIIALRLPPQTAAKAFPKYCFNISPSFFLVNGPFFPSAKEIPAFRTSAGTAVGQRFSPALPVEL